MLQVVQVAATNCHTIIAGLWDGADCAHYARKARPAAPAAHTRRISPVVRPFCHITPSAWIGPPKYGGVGSTAGPGGGAAGRARVARSAMAVPIFSRARAAAR